MSLGAHLVTMATLVPSLMLSTAWASYKLTFFSQVFQAASQASGPLLAASSHSGFRMPKSIAVKRPPDRGSYSALSRFQATAPLFFGTICKIVKALPRVVETKRWYKAFMRNCTSDVWSANINFLSSSDSLAKRIVSKSIRQAVDSKTKHHCFQSWSSPLKTLILLKMRVSMMLSSFLFSAVVAPAGVATACAALMRTSSFRASCSSLASSAISGVDMATAGDGSNALTLPCFYICTLLHLFTRASYSYGHVPSVVACSPSTV